jgi:hypothetical protein
MASSFGFAAAMKASAKNMPFTAAPRALVSPYLPVPVTCICSLIRRPEPAHPAAGDVRKLEQ